MSRARLAKIVRQFLENGLKLLLENPHNVHDLLGVVRVEVLELIDFDHLTVVSATFVQRDYRHVESDVVLRAPLRDPAGGPSRRGILIYILIEHQSEPDPLMLLRVLEYEVQIYKSQLRDWAKQHTSFAGFRLQPVLPVVFYTGLRPWEGLGSLTDLMELGERFRRRTPQLEPLFINLAALAPEVLEGKGGFFGWVLRLIQQRRAPLEEFRGLLRRAVEHLEAMPAGERLRWLELLSYIEALIYHERDRPEQPGLRETIEASVRSDESRREVQAMGQTMAEYLREKGRQEGRQEGHVRALQETLLRQLRNRFRTVPPKTARAVKATSDVKRLNGWLDQVLAAPTLDDMQIGPAK